MAGIFMIRKPDAIVPAPILLTPVTGE